MFVTDVKRLTSIAILFSLAVVSGFGCSKFHSDDAHGNDQPGGLFGQQIPDLPYNDDDRRAESGLLVDEFESTLTLSNIDSSLIHLRRALELDPHNKRAQFWLAVIRPLYELKGVAARIQPMYLKHPDGDKRYNEFISKLSNSKSPAWVRFLTVGQADIETGDELQEWIDRVVLRLTELREWLTLNRTAEFSIGSPHSLFSPLSIDAAESDVPCTSARYGPITLPRPVCGESAQSYRLNRADLEMLISYVTLFETQIRLLNAYRLDPDMVLKAFAKNELETSPRETFEKLFRAGFATYRKGAKLELTKEAFRQVFTGYQYFAENQDKFCLRNGTASVGREGFLFPFSSCLRDPDGSLTSGMQTAEKILNGESVIVNEGQPHAFAVAPIKFFDSPLPSLSSLAPLEYDRCGRVIGIDMKPLRPYISSGDLNTILESINADSRSSNCDESGARE